tara:strand:+ start:945 stop:1316 length:372 start_codon:yes stop_codon:yes gene_type:complete
MPKADAVAFFSSLFRGEHHIPSGDSCGASGVKSYWYGWSVVMHSRHYLSTWDNDMLTRAVFMAHDRLFRLEISPIRGAKLLIAIHPRLALSDAVDMPIMLGHPSLSEAVESWRKTHPLEVAND